MEEDGEEEDGRDQGPASGTTAERECVLTRSECGVKEFISHGCVHERAFKGQGGSCGCR